MLPSPAAPLEGRFLGDWKIGRTACSARSARVGDPGLQRCGLRASLLCAAPSLGCCKAFLGDAERAGRTLLCFGVRGEGGFFMICSCGGDSASDDEACLAGKLAPGSGDCTEQHVSEHPHSSRYYTSHCVMQTSEPICQRWRPWGAGKGATNNMRLSQIGHVHLRAGPGRRGGLAAAVRDAAGGAVAHAACIGAPGRLGGLHLGAGGAPEGAPRGRPDVILHRGVRTSAHHPREAVSAA